MRGSLYGSLPTLTPVILAATLALAMTWTDPAQADDADKAFDERHRAARAALDEGRLEDADQLYRDLITLYPNRVAPYEGLAETFAAVGRQRDALDLLLDVSGKLLQVSRWAEALGPLELAARLDPERAEVHALIGRVHGEERRYRQAVASLERAVELGSTDLRTLLLLAASYWETEQIEEAEVIYGRAQNVHGNTFGLLSHYGQFLLWRGRNQEAVELLEQARSLRPDDVRLLSHLGRARSQTGDVDGAIEAYEHQLLLLPENQQPETRQAHYALDLLRHRKSLAKTPDAKTPDTKTSSKMEDVPTSVVLTPVAKQAGLDFRHDPGVTEARHLPETMGAGLAWFDYDGDGWQDLYLVQSSPQSTNRLYRNKGEGTFEDVTARSGVGDKSYGQGALAADVDGDGDMDLLVTNHGPDVLLRNRDDGTFEDVSQDVGLALPGWSSSAAMADADGDGDLDLYVTGYVDYDPDHGHTCGEPGAADYCNVIFFPGTDDAFFRQGPDGRFTEVTAQSGLSHGGGRGLGVVFTDLDGDRRPDVYVANDLDANRLYRNTDRFEAGLFEDFSLLSGAAMNSEGKAEAGMGVAVGDVDGDGLPDLAVTNFDTETNTLYRNLGDLQFEDISAASGFGVPSFNLLGFGIVLRDLDLDGDLDAYVANGHVFEQPTRDTISRAQRDLLLLGDGRGRFVEQRLKAGGPERLGRGLAAADYDGDGDVDLAVQHNGDAPELLRNDTKAGGRWLGVELVGRAPNRQALGARVTLLSEKLAADGRQELKQARWVLAGESYQSSSDRRLIFGWAADELPRELEIAWPSGKVLRVQGLRVRGQSLGRYLRIAE